MQLKKIPSLLRFGERQSDVTSSQLRSGQVTEEHMETLKYLMIEAVNKRVKNIPFKSSSEGKVHDAVSIMFSGGLDSTLIAAIACQVLP